MSHREAAWAPNPTTNHSTRHSVHSVITLYPKHTDILPRSLQHTLQTNIQQCGDALCWDNLPSTQAVKPPAHRQLSASCASNPVCCWLLFIFVRRCCHLCCISSTKTKAVRLADSTNLSPDACGSPCPTAAAQQGPCTALARSHRVYWLKSSPTCHPQHLHTFPVKNVALP